MEMKKRIKKIGVLAVLLANVAIFAPKEAEGQRTVPSDVGGGTRTHACIVYKQSNDSLQVYCEGDGIACSTVHNCFRF
jgi:hypothetical protein